MKKSRSSFLFFDEWLDALDLMSADEVKQFMSALRTYRTDMIIPEFEDRYMTRLFGNVASEIENNDRHKMQVSQIRREAKLESLTKRSSNSEAVPVQAEEIVIVPDKPVETTKRFVKPTQAEVTEYFFATWNTPNNIESIKFWNHFESNGWKVGKNKMVSWKAAARTWMTNVKNRSNYGVNTKFERQVNAEQQLGAAIAQQCSAQLQQESRGGSQSQFVPPPL